VAASSGAACTEPVRLSHYATLKGAAVTVSGVSSGGFFAHQFHVAFSDVVNGAGIIAAGPFACAEQVQWPPLLRFNPYASTIVALGVCTRISRISFGPGGELAQAPEAALAVRAAQNEHRHGTIDNPGNLADDRVWLLSGTEDKVVPQAGMLALQNFYENFGTTQISADFALAATHGFPVDEFTGTTQHRKLKCHEHDLPFVIDCDKDAAGELLNFLYHNRLAKPVGEAKRERLIEFSQTEFFDLNNERASLSKAGYLYVPAGCSEGAPSGTQCRLHVAFHGCRQTTDLIADDFYWDAGYNRWAEMNNVVVLYPQVTAWQPRWDPSGLAGNPRGCWDWWGYTAGDYYNKRGVQMQAVRKMVGRLRGE
jgi:poly(3-hydroxybutyrate) depolymerase